MTRWGAGVRASRLRGNDALGAQGVARFPHVFPRHAACFSPSPRLFFPVTPPVFPRHPACFSPSRRLFFPVTPPVFPRHAACFSPSPPRRRGSNAGIYTRGLRDSRLRGNDGLGVGNDALGVGNDGLGVGNDALGVGNDGGWGRGVKTPYSLSDQPVSRASSSMTFSSSSSRSSPMWRARLSPR